MTELWTILIPILLTDILNPVLFAFLVYAVSTNQPIINSVSLLLGHTTAYFSAGILLALGMDWLTDRLASPNLIDYCIQLIIGLALLWVAQLSRSDTGKRPDVEPESMTVISAFGLGAIINFIGIPFAVPYFAALDQILKTGLSTTDALLVLGAYNLAYALPFATVPLMVSLLGSRSRPILENINAWLERISGFLMPVLLGLIGLALTADAVTYLVTGNALY
jgi:cytochrome c biogenesis protein CcdA